jgi:hypothetical protein
MSQARRSIRILGLSLLTALGLVAVTAGAAQAANGHFTLESPAKTFTELEIAEKNVLGTNGEGKLLVPGLGLTFKCTGGSFSGTALQSGIAHGTVLFSGCTVEGSPNCKLYPTALDHEMLTNEKHLAAAALGLVLLHGGEHFIVFQSGATPFSTIYTHGATCLLPLEDTVSGSVAFRIPNALTPSVSQSLQNTGVSGSLHAIQLLLNSTLLGLGYSHLGLNYGSEPAHIDGGAVSAHLSTLELWGSR